MSRPTRHILFAIVLLLFLVPAVLVAQPDASTSTRLGNYLESLENQGFSGVVLVAKGNEILLHEGYGMADPEASRKMPRDAVFTVGSISKPFTAAAILKLEEAGKLHVEDPITRYFDGVPDDKKGITLHHLLTHSAGLPGAIGDDFDFIGRDAMVQKAMSTPLAFEPGTSYEYSNVGFSLLAAIIEKVSGKPYAVYLREAVLQPAGMTETGFELALWPKERLAQGYDDEERWGTVVERFGKEGPSWYLLGNGGLHSTAADMLRWHQALQGNQVLSTASKAKAFTRHVPENEAETSFYGYGWALWDEDGAGRVVGHNGGNQIFFADFQRYIDEDVLVFLASSHAVRGIFDLGTNLARIVRDPDYAPIARAAVSIRTAGQGNDEFATKWKLEDSHQGRIAARFVEAVQSEDEARRTEITEGIYSQRLLDKVGADKLLALLGRLAGDVGRFELVAAERLGERRVELTLQPQGREEKFVVGLDFAECELGGIDGIGVEVTD